MVESLEQTNSLKYIKNIEIKDKFNTGGHLNYELYWESLCPVKDGGGKLPHRNSNLG